MSPPEAAVEQLHATRDSAGDVAKRKVLFLPAAMKGHAGPLMRLAAHFARLDGFETHVWLGGSWRGMAPEGAIVHDDFGMESIERWSAMFERIFGDLCAAPDWHSSLALMVGSLGDKEVGSAIGDSLVGAAKIIKKVSPNIVVADGMYQTGGRIPALCARHCSGSFVALQCPGRPEPWNLRLFLQLLRKHSSQFKKAAPVFKRNDQRLEEETGPPPGKGEAKPWLRLLTGCRALVKSAPGPEEVFVGPFLSVAAEPNSPEHAAQLGSSLRAWLDGDAPNAADGGAGAVPAVGPVVYVAFGTLARPSPQLLQSLARGLAGGPWRVLWALPAPLHQQVLEAAGAAAAAPGRFRLEAYAPQAAVLIHPQVKCFVSHCGQNSTHESLIAGVPMVCVPFFCDQYEWAASICKHRKAGLQLDKLRATPEQVSAAVAKVLGSEVFRENAAACREDILHAGGLANKLLLGSSGEESKSDCPAVRLAAALVDGAVDRSAAALCQPAARGSHPGQAGCACCVQ